ncbi:uncharacterized protein CTRU02_209478 [Colletotrichum truncatum]|uniref:Uncharacterized protein n=1 Tax=Colletotrichum truncatum TaxID=5467 RepID=A0ACC3YSP6_COLTU|nr:uncharacterized protein CTRU02_08443 [Colletotrichum truncatum]KAF6789744.1 hypothetical protein CTRU02_08443 [Colletotrichum truncatum]
MASISRDGSIQSVDIGLEVNVGLLVPRGKQAGFEMKFSRRPGMHKFDCDFMGNQTDETVMALFKQKGMIYD